MANDISTATVDDTTMEGVSFPEPPKALSDEIITALELHHDAAKSAEVEVAPGFTITVGIRNVYFNADGEVGVTARQHTETE